MCVCVCVCVYVCCVHWSKKCAVQLDAHNQSRFGPLSNREGAHLLLQPLLLFPLQLECQYDASARTLDAVDTIDRDHSGVPGLDPNRPTVSPAQPVHVTDCAICLADGDETGHHHHSAKQRHHTQDRGGGRGRRAGRCRQRPGAFVWPCLSRRLCASLALCSANMPHLPRVGGVMQCLVYSGLFTLSAELKTHTHTITHPSTRIPHEKKGTDTRSPHLRLLLGTPCYWVSFPFYLCHPTVVKCLNRQAGAKETRAARSCAWGKKNRRRSPRAGQWTTPYAPGNREPHCRLQQA